MRRAWWRVAGSVVTAVGLYQRVVRPWQLHWGATSEEAAAVLPGDGTVAGPASRITRAITVCAPPAAVWPWLVQLGADRGGFYSYDRLENLFGLGIHSADVIVPGWQERAVGDFVPASAGQTAGWYVADLRPLDALVLRAGDRRVGRPATRADPPGWEFAWTFAVRPGPGGTTRLLVREQVGFRNAFVRVALGPVGFVSFVMTRRMMQGIKARAEAGGGEPYGRS